MKPPYKTSRPAPPVTIDTSSGRSEQLSTLPDRHQAARDLKESVFEVVRTVGFTLAVVWGIGLLNLLTGGFLNNFGILPRSLTGLVGIFLWPLLHGGFFHLLGNTIAYLALGTMVLARNPRHYWFVTIAGTLLGGLGVWLFARGNIHIGASGVIFSYLGYLFATGIFERRLGAIALSSVSILAYGSMVFGMLPITPGVSFEGHIAGFAAGIFSAWFLARDQRKRLPS
jgi:membrane associated rhomboid family serine protease